MNRPSTPLNPADFVIVRKRKKYRFALFANSQLCYELDDWQSQTPIDIVEVGAGTGRFSVHLAELYPRKRILAVDVKADRLQDGAREAEERGLRRISFLRARIDQLPDALVPHSLESLWVTFPDPYPKRRSAKNRLTAPSYLKVYASLLRPGGSLYMKTDARDLFDWSLEQLVSSGWHLSHLSYDLHESSFGEPYTFKTTYEVKYDAQGKPIYFLAAYSPR